MAHIQEEVPLSTDPLIALGDSTFFDILLLVPPATLAAVSAVCRSWREYSLANQSGIWRAACHRTGINPAFVDVYVEEERLDGPRDWKGMCLVELLNNRNKRLGRCKDKWVLNGEAHGRVWRFSHDEHDSTVVTTNQDFGLCVFSTLQSLVMFIIHGIREFAQLEHCRGFVVVDPYEGMDTMQVYRDFLAIARSPRTYSSARSLPSVVSTSRSMVGDWSPDLALAPEYRTSAAQGSKSASEMKADALALRYALTFYREIDPPTPCTVFRVHSDAMYTRAECVVLAAGGESGVYIWELENDEKEPDTFRFPQGLQVGVMSLELDENYVFVGGIQQVHVFDRRTKQYLLAFPPVQATLSETCAAVYTMDDTDSALVEAPPPPFELQVAESRQSSSVNSPSIMGRLELPGYLSKASRYTATMSGGRACVDGENTTWVSSGPSEEADRLTGQHLFIACRHTRSDLVCATRTGHLLIIRDFTSILALSDPLERQLQIGRQTILINFGKKIRHLATGHDHITVGTSKRIFFLETNTLPFPYPLLGSGVNNELAADSPLPRLRLHCSLDISSREAESATCAQIMGQGVHYSYTARGIGRPPLMPSQVVENDGADRDDDETERNEVGPGRWIRGWDFEYHEADLDPRVDMRPSQEDKVVSASV